ncbi:MAG: hypothetical protein ACJ790_22305 [Myxococcaceae bacterium]
MNVTVRVPPALRPAVEGRKELSLGLPATADVGDLIDTLLALYPKLRMFMATDTKQARQALSLFLPESALHELAHKRPALREGQVVYLVGGLVRREEGRA